MNHRRSDEVALPIRRHGRAFAVEVRAKGADAKAGHYKTIISLTSGGAPVASCIVKLEVWDFALPEESRLLQAMGGDIKIESTTGGAQFTFWLPLGTSGEI